MKILKNWGDQPKNVGPNFHRCTAPEFLPLNAELCVDGKNRGWYVIEIEKRENYKTEKSKKPKEELVRTAIYCWFLEE
jgi:hypothetical protein